MKYASVAMLLCAAVLSAAAGCSTLDVQVSPGVEPQAQWRMLILPPDDRPAGTRATDVSLYGATGGQGCAAVIRARLSCAFQKTDGFASVTDGELGAALRRERLTLAQAAALAPDKASALARDVRADMIVTGQVERYEKRWILFLPWSRVAISLTGQDAAAGRTLWRAHAASGGLFHSEESILNAIGVQTAESLAAGLLSR